MGVASAAWDRPTDDSTSLSMTVEKLFGEEVVEGFYGVELVVLYVENGVELGDVQDVVNLLGEIEEFELAPGVADGGKAADQFADAGGIDVIDVSEVEDDFLLAIADELADGIAQLSGFVAEGDASIHVDDGNVADFARSDVHGSGPIDCTAELGDSTTEPPFGAQGKLRHGEMFLGVAAKHRSRSGDGGVKIPRLLGVTK